MKQKRVVKGILSVILTLALVFGMVPVPGAVLTSLANNVGAYNDYLVTTDANKDKSGEDLAALQVTFNGIPWYIIEDNSESATTGSITLLAADTSFGTSRFNPSYNSTYQNSIVEQYLASVVAGTAGEGKPNFLNVSGVIKNTNEGKLYLLTNDEATLLPENVRTISEQWWLRTAARIEGCVYSVGSDGNTKEFTNVTSSFLVRPALQLNLSSYVSFNPSNREFNISSDAPIDNPNLAVGLWSGEMFVIDDMEINHDVFLGDDTTLTVAEGKTLIINGSIVSDYDESTEEYTNMLTVKGAGKVIVVAPEADNGTVSPEVTPGSGGNNANGTVAEVVGKVSSAAEKVRTVAEKINSAASKIAPMLVNVNGETVVYNYGYNTGKVTSIEEKIGDAAGKVQNVAGKVMDAAGKVVAGSGKVKDVAGKVSTVADKVADAAGKVTNVAGKVGASAAAGEVSLAGRKVPSVTGKVTSITENTQSADETWNIIEKENAGIYCNVVLAGCELQSCDYYGDVAVSEGLTYSADLGQMTDTFYTAEQASVQLAGKLLSTKEALIEGLWVGDSEEVKTTGVIFGTESLGTATLSIEDEALVLTLEDFAYVGTGHKGGEQAASIYYNGTVPLTIRSLGTSIIENTATESSNGIYIEEADCSFSGDGMLMVISGEVSGSTSNAIAANKGLTISSGTIVAFAGKTDNSASRGIFCESGGIIMNGGTVLAQGDTDSEGSNGVRVEGNDSIVLNGGYLCAFGNGCGLDTNASKILLNGGALYSSGYDVSDGITVGTGLTYTDGTTSFSAGDISDISGLAEKDIRIADETSLKKLLSDPNTVEVVLRDDYVTTSSIEVKGTKTLDLNGHGIMMTGSDSVIMLEQSSGDTGKGATLYLTDSNPNAVHYITLNEGRGTAVADSGEESESCIKATGGYITGGSGHEEGNFVKGCGVYVGDSSFTMNGGTIIGNGAGATDVVYGGGVYVEKGSFTMNGGAITCNSAGRADTTGYAQGGGVYVGKGSFTMNGGEVSGNFAKGKTWAFGGVYLSSGMFTMNDGEVSDNYSACASVGEGNACGGVEVWGTFIMNGGKVCGNDANTAYKACGGVYVMADHTFIINGGEISGNTASGAVTYGGVYVSNDGIISVSKNAKVSGNTVQDTASNVNLCSGEHPSFITVSGALTDKADIHVCNSGCVAKGGSYTITDLDAARFVCDNDEYAPKLNTGNNQIYMVNATHTVSVADGIEHGTVTVPAKVADGATVILTVTPDIDYVVDTVSYNDGSSDNTITPDSAGRYSFTMPASDVTVSATFAPGASVTTEPTAATGLTYTGEEQDLLASAGVASTSMEYSQDGTNWITTVPKAIAPDTYTVYYRAAGDDTLSASEKRQLEVTIGKAPLIVTAKPKTIFYGDEPANDGVTYTGFVNDETEAVLSGTLAYTYNYTKNGNVGSYKIIPKGLTSDNYAITFVSGTLTVTENVANITTEPTAATGLTYTGVAQDLLTSAGEANTSMEYSLDGINWSTTVPKATAADTYTVYYRAAEDALRSASEATQVEVIISKAALTVTAKPKTITYGDEPANDGVTYAGFVNNETKAVLGGTLAYTYNYTKNGNVGSYSITPKGLTSDNYAITYVSGALTVTKNTASVTTAPAKATGLTYTGKAQNLLASAGVADSTLEYSLNGTSWSTNIPKGTLPNIYTVYYRAKADTNHIASEEAQLEVTIGKAPLTVTANANTITYGDEPANAGVTYTGFVNNETAAVLSGTLDYTYSYTQYGNAGSYKITPKGLASDNYAITFTAGTLTVAKKEVGLTWSEDTEFTFDGRSHAPTATATGLLNNDVVSVSVSGAKTNANTDAVPNYTATASGLTGTKAGNYKLPTENTTKEFSIVKAAAQTLTNVTADKYFNLTSISASAAGKMPSNAGTLTYTKGTVAKTGAVTVSSWSVDANGKITATIAGGAKGNTITFPVIITSDNYEDSTVNMVVTLTECPHERTEVREAKETSCSEPGYTGDTYCLDCGEKIATGEAIDTIDHTKAEPVKENEIAPKCEEKGSYDEVIYCSVCGAEIRREKKETDPTGHLWGEWVVTTPATETEEGVETCVCKNDETHTDTRPIPKLDHVHKIVPVDEIAPTCTKDGTKAHFACEGCELLFEDEAGEKEITDESTLVIPAAHKGGKATCAKGAICEVCGEEYGEKDPANHTGETEIKNAVEPTCTRQGYTGDICCKDCGVKLADGETTDATGHKQAEPVKENEIAATCNAEGSYETVIYCEVCKEELTRGKTILSKLKHEWDEGKITKEATYTEAGVKTYTCTLCGETREEEVPQLEVKDFTKCTTTNITDKVYNGKLYTPAVVVKYDGKSLKKGKDYTVKYSCNKLPGTATVKITGINGFKGTITKTFTIKPRATSVTSVTAGDKCFTVKWGKCTTGKTTGYQIQYGTNKSFAKGTFKYATIKTNTTIKKKVTNLTSGKTYYVRVRTYRTVNGKNVYSAWSDVESVKVK